MKTQQWQLLKVTEPRTLADVPGSRERPVLFWSGNGILTHGFNDPVQGPVRLDREGAILPTHFKSSECLLYTQPSRPKTLEDVPDRRVICTPGSELEAGQLWFRDSGTWYLLAKSVNSQIQNSGGKPRGTWQLTDHCVELVEMEIGVMG